MSQLDRLRERNKHHEAIYTSVSDLRKDVESMQGQRIPMCSNRMCLYDYDEFNSREHHFHVEFVDADTASSYSEFQTLLLGMPRSERVLEKFALTVWRMENFAAHFKKGMLFCTIRSLLTVDNCRESVSVKAYSECPTMEVNASRNYYGPRSNGASNSTIKALLWFHTEKFMSTYDGGDYIFNIFHSQIHLFVNIIV